MTIGLRTPGLREIAVLGVRCGDIASGMGGTLLTLTSERALSLRIHALVLSGADTRHEVEEHRTLAAVPGFSEFPGVADLSEDSCLAEHIAQVFRDHLVLGYETPQRPAPVTATTTLFHPLAPEDARGKAQMLDPGPSDGLDPAQHAAHLALARLRGSQCGNPFAEAVLAEKVVLPDGSAQPSAVGIRETGLPQ